MKTLERRIRAIEERMAEREVSTFDPAVEARVDAENGGIFGDLYVVEPDSETDQCEGDFITSR